MFLVEQQMLALFVTRRGETTGATSIAIQKRKKRMEDKTVITKKIKNRTWPSVKLHRQAMCLLETLYLSLVDFESQAIMHTFRA